jgi:RHS repeat-associated protein
LDIVFYENEININNGIQHWQPFDAWPSSGWVKAGNVTVIGGKLKLNGNGSWGSTYAYRNSPLQLKDGQAVKFSFQVDATTNEAFISVDRGTWGNTEYRSWTLRIESGYLKREYYYGTLNNKTTLMAVKANTWYEGVLAIDGTAPGSSSESFIPRFRLVVWEKSNPASYAQDRVSFSTGWSWTDWKFVTQIKTSGKVLYIDYELEYDDGAIGQRNKMTDGSGNTQWTFTTRGQVQSESKKIETNTYLTQYGYYPDGSLRWMQYPDNEKLTYTNLPQKAAYSVQTSLESGLFYVESTSYGDVYYSTNERFILRKLGGSNALQLKSTFFAWGTANGQGRLKQLTAGTTSNPTLLLNLKYFTGTETPAYDAVGNIKSILDATNSNQKQCFGYDSLNRLISAAVGIDDTTCSGSVGNGEYANETYTYDSTTGNLSSKTGLGNYNYGDSEHAHAVTATGNGNSYSYDDNGNQTTRVINGVGTFYLTYDAENRLVNVSGTLSASFLFDGDGNRVKSTIGSSTTTFVGTYYEIISSSITKYYYQGASRVAIRNSNGVRYFFNDHLGSTSVTADSSGGNVIRQLYTAWGEVRYSSSSLPTKYTYTGQYAYNSSGEIGLMYYVARFYDPVVGRFIQADSIISNPDSNLGWDRHSYVWNNPLIFTDPYGHCSGNPNDPENPDLACWEMLYKIQDTYGNIHIYDQEKWLLAELQAIWNALLNHIFIYQILSASAINFYRENFMSYPGDMIGGAVSGESGTYNIIIYDAAYLLLPNCNGLGYPSITNFTGVIIHELTHIALGQDPFIMKSYDMRSNWLYYPETILPPPFMTEYDQESCVDNCDAERIAVASSTWQLEPETFNTNILFISYTDWHKNWIELFYHPNPLVRYDYGQTFITTP